MQSTRWKLLLVVVFLSAVLSFVIPAVSCPLCPAQSISLSERVAQSDATVLVQWVEAQKADKNSGGTTTYQVVEIHKASDTTHKKGKRITLARHRSGKKGDLFLLTGTAGTNQILEWSSPIEITETGYNYVAQAPSSDTPTGQRLKYFLKFLEFSEPLIASDAFAEFSTAPYSDVAALADILPRKKIRSWIADENSLKIRFGLYGLMLGLSGNKDDAEFLKQQILEESKPDEFRLGIDGLISGYLLILGEEGLPTIEDSKFRNTKISFSETYSAMRALRFMWTYAPNRIPKDRLKASMRILVDRPELADLVIADLARWKDWAIQDRLMKMYGDKDFDNPHVKLAIIRYMLVSTKDSKNPKAEQQPAHVIKGNKYLEQLRKTDPKTVKDTERFFFLK